MVKRKRNTIGQFISSASSHIGPKGGLIQENFLQRVITGFMALLFEAKFYQTWHSWHSWHISHTSHSWHTWNTRNTGILGIRIIYLLN